MYVGTLEVASNRADWRVFIELWDTAEDEYVSLDDCSFVLAVNREGQQAAILSGTDDDGHIVVDGEGVFHWRFTSDEMSALCAGTYDFGLTISIYDETVQLIIGKLPVIDGIVP